MVEIEWNRVANLDDQAVFDLNIPENTLFEQAVHFSGTEDDIFVQIITLDNYFVLKMVIGWGTRWR